VDPQLLGFHVSRLPRDRYQFDDGFFNYWGKAHLPNFQRARAFANQINQKRDVAHFPDQAIQPSQVNAVALIQGITHFIFRLYLQRHPGLLSQAALYLQGLYSDDFEKTMRRFVDQFPPQPVYDQQQTPEQFLAGITDGRPNREAALEELVMLWVANVNPAFTPLSEFFSDDQLKQQTAYNRIRLELNMFFAKVGKDDLGDSIFPAGVNIIDLLLDMVRRSPHSLEGQLRGLVEDFSDVAGTSVYRMLTAMDIIREDFRAIPGHLGPGGMSPEGKGSTPVPYFDWAAAQYEPENFTPDRAWMPNLVLLARNAYVWLDQLSRRYGRPITTLDQVPDEELDQLARWGFTGLWLIGLWERSTASQRIKQLTGNPDAVASAYSLIRYEIAQRLGGEPAYENLRDRAWQRGIRLASDMVPNHMGIDSDWVIDHPDWFLSLPYPPYPVYTFDGPDLSPNPNIGIFLEDHYYTRTDAAVVFKRVDYRTGDTRYIYHGNDGTLMPWNDTAQLNYLHPQVREAMIQVILDIARRFPVIRFDAAMTLVKKHVQRLWFPEPGAGGAIPSRSEHGMTRAEFEMQMPEEFWREVIDRAAVEAPDTLLLAEAFWLLEGYFVRTLGMHRVYNSAFMNMLRDEDNAKYRLVMKNTIEFDPEVLRRYVNFLNNPDEKTAVEQFGKGDKYFGVTTLMLTMPGLPMFGHGQIEGFAEKYGMEYYRAYWDETPDQYLIQRHEHEIFPLVKKRYLFAGVDNFLLYDFYLSDGSVDENVFAYSNMARGERALVFYNNALNNTQGYIRTSAAYSVKDEGDSRVLVQRDLADGLELPSDESKWCIFRDHNAGLEYLRNCRELHESGVFVSLKGYQYIVLIDFRVVEDSIAYPYHQLAQYLGGRGVPSVDEALRELMVAPVRAPFRELVNADTFRRLLDARTQPDPTLMDEIEAKTVTLLEAVQAFVAEPEVEETEPTAIEVEVVDEVDEPEVALNALDEEEEEEPLYEPIEDDVIRVTSEELEAIVAVSIEDEGELVELTPEDAFEADIPEDLIEEVVDPLALSAHEVRLTLETLLSLPYSDTPEPLLALLYGTEPQAVPLDDGMDDEVLDEAASDLVPESSANGTDPTIPPEQPALWCGLFGWAVARGLGDSETVRSWLDEWLLSRIIGDAIFGLGTGEREVFQSVSAVELAMALAEIFTPDEDETASDLLELLLVDMDAQALLGVNHFQGIVWFSKEGMETMLRWLLLVGQLTAPSLDALDARYQTIAQLHEAMLESGYQLTKLRAAVRVAARS
jgi:glycosidase